MLLIIGISGASGAIMGYRLLQELSSINEIETHLVISDAAKKTFELETAIGLEEVISLADHYYENDDLAAPIASGSFLTSGMIVLPCSMKTLSGVVTGFTENLLTRAVDVCLKEGRPVVLVPREMPLSKIHLKNLLAASEYGCKIIPPMLTFYHNFQTTDEQILHILGKILMQFDLKLSSYKPWTGTQQN